MNTLVKVNLPEDKQNSDAINRNFTNIWNELQELKNKAQVSFVSRDNDSVTIRVGGTNIRIATGA